MKTRYYKIWSTAIENGVEAGWSYAHKYNEHPSKDEIKEAIFDHIMNELFEWFSFEESDK